MLRLCLHGLVRYVVWEPGRNSALLPIYKNYMFVAAKFMVDLQGMHFNAKKALFINFQNHASIFCKTMIIKINGGGHGRFYVLPTSVCATKNNYSP